MIVIHNESCLRCGKCSKVCPAGVLTQNEKGEDISINNIDFCIVCGHCVDVCPTASVVHSEFPQERIHPIDYSLFPTPEQVMTLIKTRRSNRALISTPIPDDVLEKIVESARFAPTASNKRDVSFTLITDPEKLLKISEFTINKFESSVKILINPLIKCLLKPFFPHLYNYIPAFYRLKKEHLNGNDPILRKATALLIIHTPKSSDFGCENANLAYQNASLMAYSLGVSQIYMGFVLKAIRKSGREAFAQITGVDGEVQAIMALGIPAFRYTNYIE